MWYRRKLKEKKLKPDSARFNANEKPNELDAPDQPQRRFGHTEWELSGR
jgi:hypothetical protein